MVEDPTARYRPNKLARTVGFYGHTPKFWDCTKYDFDNGWMKFQRRDEPAPDWWEGFSAQQKAGHANCTRKHMSYVGYLKFVGPKNTYTWWFMGGGPDDKVFQKYPSGTIIFLGKPLPTKKEEN